jgi:ribosome-associated protein
MTQDTSTKYIELNAFLRINGAANTGGRVKLIIREGLVKVNGETETRNKKKLRPGDSVEYNGKIYEVKEKMLR